jgi:hypothetical protein
LNVSLTDSIINCKTDAQEEREKMAAYTYIFRSGEPKITILGA